MFISKYLTLKNQKYFDVHISRITQLEMICFPYS